MKGTWQTTDSGSGIGTAAAVVLAAAVIAAVAVPVVRAVTHLLEVLAVVMAVVLGVGLLAGIALVAWRLRQGRQNTPLVVHRATPVTHRAAEPLTAPQQARAALPAPERPELHLHFHGMSAADVAAVIAQHGQPVRPSIEEE